MKKFINNVSALQFYQLARYSTLILIGVVFTKTSLTKGEIGEYETFLFLAGAVSFFWLNGFLKALLPFAGKHEESNGEKPNPVIFNSFLLLSVFSLFFALFIFLAQPLFSEFLLKNKGVPAINLLIVYIVFGVPANLIEYIYLLKKKNHAIVRYALVSFIIQFALVVVPAVFGYGVEKILLGLVVSIMLRYAWLWKVLLQYSQITFSWIFIKQHFKLGWPLVLATFLSGSAQYVDGFIVTTYFDEGTFAIFRYGARELPLALMLANALSLSMLPKMQSKDDFDGNLKLLKKNAELLAHFLFPVSAVLLVVSYPLFPIIFNDDFTQSASIFNIYLLLITSRLLFPQTILIGLQKNNRILQSSFLELILNISLSLLFVRFWGISGIAFATVIAYLFEKIYLVVFVKRNLNIGISRYMPVKLHLIYSVALIFLFIFVEIFIK